MHTLPRTCNLIFLHAGTHMTLSLDSRFVIRLIFGSLEYGKKSYVNFICCRLMWVLLDKNLFWHYSIFEVNGYSFNMKWTFVSLILLTSFKFKRQHGDQLRDLENIDGRNFDFWYSPTKCRCLLDTAQSISSQLRQGSYFWPPGLHRSQLLIVFCSQWGSADTQWRERVGRKQRPFIALRGHRRDAVIDNIHFEGAHGQGNEMPGLVPSHGRKRSDIFMSSIEEISIL